MIGPNELTRQLVSDSCLKQLIDFMLRGGNPLTVGVGIIIEVIRKNNSDYDLENQIGPVPKNSDPIYLGTLLRQFALHIPRFMELVHSTSQIVTQKDGNTTTRKRELKTAFGEKIEPLGFDRFKTCELMAELLHCSNMALLNERGSEAEVRRRDAERERLKAEGKLTTDLNTTTDDFATSVDSHGFHHARAPSMDSPAEIKPLQVQNTSEDDFEKVTAPELATEAEKSGKEQIGEPLERSPKVTPKESPSEKPSGGDSDLFDEPLTPPSTESSNTETVTTPKSSDVAESPTSAGLSDKVGGLDLDNDTVMGERSEQPDPTQSEIENKEKPSLLTQQLNQSLEPSHIDPADTLSPHPDVDKPAPLFAGKKRESNTEAPSVDISKFTAPVPEIHDEITPIDDTGSARSVVFGSIEDDANAGFEIDIDGTPVVGDLLKITFVDNKVVPTILVSDSSSAYPTSLMHAGLLLPVSMEQFSSQRSIRCCTAGVQWTDGSWLQPATSCRSI